MQEVADLQGTRVLGSTILISMAQKPETMAIVAESDRNRPNRTRFYVVGAVRGKNRGLGEQLDKSMKLFPVDLWVIYLSSGGGPKKSTV